MKGLKHESGQALVLVMMVITVMLLMGSSMLTRGGESRKASFEERKIVQAHYIAEAGAEKAISAIKNNPIWLKGLTFNSDVPYIGPPAAAYAGGQITGVVVKRTSDTANPTTFYIESLGEYQGARRTIQVCGEMYSPFNFPGEGWLSSLDENWYAKNADRVLPDNLSGSFHVDGILYASGNISLSGTYSGAGTIVAGGKVTINGDLTRADADSSLAVISFGDPVGIEMRNSLTVYALLYTPGKISIGDNSHVYGSVVCSIVDIGQDAAVSDDDTLKNKQPFWIATVIRITSWKEKYSVF